MIEDTVSLHRRPRWLVLGLVLASAAMPGFLPQAHGQAESARKVQTRTIPAYPDLARRMRIAGVVKVQVTVAPNGTVKDATVVGGHPLLADAVITAVRRWRFMRQAGSKTPGLQPLRFALYFL